MSMHLRLRFLCLAFVQYRLGTHFAPDPIIFSLLDNATVSCDIDTGKWLLKDCTPQTSVPDGI